jgi:hypothetical protein
MAAGLKFGANGILAINQGTYGGPSWVNVKTVQDVTATLEYEKADASSRGQNGFGATEPTLAMVSLSFKILEDTADAAYLLLRAAAFAKTTVCDMMCCSGTIGASGETSVRSDYKIIGWKKSEPIKDVNTFDVEMERCYSANPVVVV